MELMADGLPGHLHEFYRPIKNATWLGGDEEYSCMRHLSFSVTIADVPQGSTRLGRTTTMRSSRWRGRPTMHASNTMSCESPIGL
jgi:hypothetical protein